MKNVLSIIPNLFATCPYLVDEMKDAGINLVENRFDHWVDLPNYADILPTVDGIITGGNGRFNEALFQTAPRLKIIAKTGKGLDNIDIHKASERGIAVTNTGSVNANGVAELAVLHALAVLRAAPKLDRSLRAGRWSLPEGREIKGKTVGIVGYGAIARLAAKKFAAFEPAEVLVCDVFPIPPDSLAPCGGVQVAFEELLARADIISLHVPECPENHHMINEATISLMKDRAVIINTSRGGLVDERALYAALKTGKLGGAGLDSFEAEPLAPGNPLLTLEQVFCTSHVGGTTEESVIADCTVVANNLIAYFTGNVPPNQVN